MPLLHYLLYQEFDNTSYHAYKSSPLFIKKLALRGLLNSLPIVPLNSGDRHKTDIRTISEVIDECFRITYDFTHSTNIHISEDHNQVQVTYGRASMIGAAIRRVDKNKFEVAGMYDAD